MMFPFLNKKASFLESFFKKKQSLHLLESKIKTLHNNKNFREND